MGAKINLSNTAGELQQDANGNAMVNLPRTQSQAGYAAMTTEVHDGGSGAARKLRNVMASQRFRLRASLDAPLWDDNFNFGTINTRKYSSGGTTMTATQTGGAFVLNNGSSVASSTGYLIRSYSIFQMASEAPLVATALFSLAATPMTNNEISIGIGIPNTATTVPLDGVYMRIDNTGSLELITNYGGSVSAVGPIAYTFTANTVYEMKLVIYRSYAELWVNDILVAEVTRTGTAPSAPSLTMAASGNLFALERNTGVTGSAQKLSIYSWSVQSTDLDYNRTIGELAAEQYNIAVSAPDGATVGQTANIANSAAPASATLSNTAAGYTTLGGNWQFAAVAGAETDYALFAYQVPAAATSAGDKSLVVKGVEIDTFNMGAAVATTPTLLTWYLGIGSTAVSLATADAATTKAPHRIPLGSQSLAIGTAIGARADRNISVNFSAAPLIVSPGEYVHIILRMPVGTATASQIIRGACGIVGHFK